MATVALVGNDVAPVKWRQTSPVLQLIPNSPKGGGSRETRGTDHGFPTLAVTRSRDEKRRADMTLRSPSLSSDCSDSFESGKSSDHSSNRSWRNANRSLKNTNSPAAPCSVQDLNKQILSGTRKFSPDVRVSSANCFARELAAVSKLQKPVSRTADVYNFLNQNGFLGSPLTPGEMDLKRFKNSCAKEHAKRTKKKFKLNVRELPRSTTPINDHDPDKLNMKQVIAFLQDQPQRQWGEHIQFNSAAEKRVFLQPKGSSVEGPVFSNFVEKQSIRPDRCFSEPPSLSPSTRDIACQSVTSVRSTPSKFKRVQTSARCYGARSTGRSTESQVRPYSDIPGRDNRFQTFLSLEPNGLGLTTTPQYKIVDKSSEDVSEPQVLPVVYRSSRLTNAKCIESLLNKSDNDVSLTVRCPGMNKNPEEGSLNKIVKAETDQNKAAIINKHPSDSGISDVSQSDAKQEGSSKSSDSGAIRVPVLNDFEDEWDIESEKERSDTPEKQESTKRIAPHSPRDSISCPKLECRVPSKLDCRVPFGAKRVPHLSGVFRYTPSSRENRKMKTINVEVPHGNGPEFFRSDVIKLTMRQDSAVTRHTSYMSDIAIGQQERSDSTYLPIISIQDVHGSMVAGTSHPASDRTAIRPKTVSMTFDKNNDKENKIARPKRNEEFDRIRRKKKSIC